LKPQICVTAVRTVLLAALLISCRDAASVDPILGPKRSANELGPPDAMPANLYEDSNLIQNSPELFGSFVKDVVIVLFQPTASQESRDSAVASVGGEVVGGVPFLDIDGAYLVRVPADSRR
jgi:hypothetical protein